MIIIIIGLTLLTIVSIGYLVYKRFNIKEGVDESTNNYNPNNCGLTGENKEKSCMGWYAEGVGGTKSNGPNACSPKYLSISEPYLNGRCAADLIDMDPPDFWCTPEYATDAPCWWVGGVQCLAKHNGSCPSYAFDCSGAVDTLHQIDKTTPGYNDQVKVLRAHKCVPAQSSWNKAYNEDVEAAKAAAVGVAAAAVVTKTQTDLDNAKAAAADAVVAAESDATNNTAKNAVRDTQKELDEAIEKHDVATNAAADANENTAYYECDNNNKICKKVDIPGTNTYAAMDTCNSSCKPPPPITTDPNVWYITDTSTPGLILKSDCTDVNQSITSVTGPERNNRWYSCPEVAKPYCTQVQQNNPLLKDAGTGETGRCCKYININYGDATTTNGNITSLPALPDKHEQYFFWDNATKTKWKQAEYCTPSYEELTPKTGLGETESGGSGTSVGGGGSGTSVGVESTGMRPTSGPNTLYNLFMDFFSQTPSDIVSTLMVANEMKDNKELENQARSLDQLDKIQQDLGNLRNLPASTSVPKAASSQTFAYTTVPSITIPKPLNSIWTLYQ
jgi:hypothetical protein